MSELVQKLSNGQHRVILRPGGKDPMAELRRRLDAGYLHVYFPDTKGGTELGVHLTPAALDAGKADFDNRSGSLGLAGILKLDYVPVRCSAQVELSTLEGTGRLEVLTEEEYQELRSVSVRGPWVS